MTQRFKKINILIVLIITTIGSVRSQNWEIGVMAGGSNYYGDVANQFHLENIRYSFLGFVRKHISQRFVLRSNLGYIRIAGIDHLSTDSKYQQVRNLDFFTEMVEGSLQLEYNFVDDKTRGRRIKNYTIPYVFAGIGGIYFTPQTEYNGQVYNLARIQTSGTNYSQIALVVPIGGGVRYYLTPNWQIGFELGIRFTNTSNLDDIDGYSKWPDPVSLPSDLARALYDRSTVPVRPDGYRLGVPGTSRGKIKYITDIYATYGITLSYKLGLLKGSHFKGKSIRCPRFY